MTDSLPWIIAGMMLVTYVPRLLPLVLRRGRTPRPWQRRTLHLVPFAAIGALIIPDGLRAIEDDRQYGVAEHWALPTRTGGDCEDFALLKKRELVSVGIDPSRLLLATVLDRQRNPHAVLVFRSDAGDLVLDNLTNQIRPWRATRYMFLQMQDPDRPTRWVNVFASG